MGAIARENSNITRNPGYVQIIIGRHLYDVYIVCLYGLLYVFHVLLLLLLYVFCYFLFLFFLF